MFSLLDGFFGYNHILVTQNAQLKTAFQTKWGTYAYQKTPFTLINARDVFQRVIDITFGAFINKYFVVYLDDVTVYSKNKTDHIKYLKEVFERCRKFGMSLNPKKSVFVVADGKLLGFIIYK